MIRTNWKTNLLRCIAPVLLAGCRTISNPVDFETGPLSLRNDEVIVRDQLIVLVDVTGSIGFLGQYQNEIGLVQAFTDAMPQGNYLSGIDSFAGVSRNDWLLRPLAPFSRERMVDAAYRIRPLGSTTPLAEAIRNQKDEVAGIGGRGALLVFSDGEVLDPNDVLHACRELKAAHGGEFCIYTVLIGQDHDGRELMKEMARVNGCGKYFDGATLTSPETIESMARTIFLGDNEVPRANEVIVSGPEELPLNLRNILFDNDSSTIAASYDGQLNKIAAIMQRVPAMRLRLDGHTDFHASNAYNQKLSERRVNAVQAALVQRGADPGRLSAGAHGEEQPAVPNTTPENLHQNRRVELTVIK